METVYLIIIIALVGLAGWQTYKLIKDIINKHNKKKGDSNNVVKKNN